MISIDLLETNDIWSKVLKYLSISLNHDTESEIRYKRRALRCAALLHPSLTSKALNALWESMTSLEPITHVINSEASSPSQSVLRFSQEAGGIWCLEVPLTPDRRKRALEYLDRVLHIRASLGDVREMDLWSTLYMTLGTVLPNVESISLDFKHAREIGTWKHAINPLLSSALVTISCNHVFDIHVSGITTLLSSLKSQSMALTYISYDGSPSPFLLRNCLAFDELDVLKLKFKFSESPIQRYTEGPSISEIFEKLRNLKNLEIDLRVFPLHDTTSTITCMVPPSSLISLHIDGDISDISSFLKGTSSPSLRSLSVAIFQANRLAWKPLCYYIMSNFPELESLCFRRAGETLRALVMEDLSVLFSQSSIQSLKMDGISHFLTEKNISTMLDLWPTLHTLAIMNDTSIHSFLEDAPIYEQIAGSSSPIQMLTMTSIAATSSPPNLDKKIEMARNLSALFPRLERIVTFSSSHQVSVSELEKLCQSFRGVIVTYLRRRDFEKRSIGRRVVH